MLISDTYREQQTALHEATEYGVASIAYAPIVARVVNQHGVSELLDYGAGRMNLMRTIEKDRLVKHAFRYRPYDPAIPEIADTPEPAEMVACIDVLEHIEPLCLDDVLDDLVRLTRRIALLTVHCGPAAKTLVDGRNAHLIQKPPEWWLPQLMARWELHVFQKQPGGFLALMQPYMNGH